VIEKVVKENPFMMPFTIKAGTYDKQTDDCKVVADGNFLVVNSKMSDEVAYNCVKIFIEKRGDIEKTTPHASEFVPAKSGIGIIPFHPGAAKYFAEHGVKVDTK